MVSFGGTLLFAIALVITPLFPFDSQMRGVLLCSNALSERILKQLISLVTVHNQKERKKSREKERERTHCTANAQPFEKSNQNKRSKQREQCKQCKQCKHCAMQAKQAL